MLRANAIRWLLLFCGTALSSMLVDRALFADEPPAIGEETSSEKAIRLALEKPIEIDWIEVPPSEVVVELNEKYGVPIHIDEKALKDVGLDARTVVTKKLKGVTLKAALRLILKEMDLDWMVRDDVLLITTPEEIEDHFITRVYPVDDLLGKHHPDGFRKQKDRLIDILTSTIASRVWDGNSGSYDFVGSSLVVVQSRETHQEVAELLEMLRRSQASYANWDGKTRPIPDLASMLDVHKMGPLAEKWNQRRRQVVNFEFVETPLHEAIDYLRELTDFEFQIDEKAIVDVGIDVKSPVTFKAKLPLESGLRIFLRQLDLTFVARDEVVLITTAEEVNARLDTWVFPVFDLVSGEDPADILADDSPIHSAKELVEAIRAVVDPVKQGGGPGSVEYYAESGSIVVSETSDMMPRVAALLTRLRQTQPIAPKIDRAQADAKIVTRIYGPWGFNPEESKLIAGGLAEAIRALVEPDSWSDPKSGAKLIVVNHRLMIHHQVRVHAKIERLIHQYHEPQAGRGGFGNPPPQGPAAPPAQPKPEAKPAPPPVEPKHAVPAKSAPAPADPFAPPQAAPAPAPADPFAPDPFGPAPAPAPAPKPAPALPPFDPFAPVPGQPPAPAPRDGDDPFRAAAKVPPDRGLEQRVDIDVVAVPLAKAVEKLSQASGATIELDRRALADVGIDTNTEITLQFKQLRLKSILAHLGAETDTVWCLRDGVIVLTTPEEANAKLVTRVYPVGDLLIAKKREHPASLSVADHRMHVLGEPDSDALLDIIWSSIEPTTWDMVGGPGSIDIWGSALIVSQTQNVQDQIADLLASLRRSLASYEKWNGRDHAIPDLPREAAWHSEEEVVGWESARRKPITLKLKEVTPDDLARELQKQTGVPFSIHRKSLLDEQITDRHKFTYSCRDKPLEEALGEWLGPSRLAAHPFYETIRIASAAEVTVARLPVWVFPVFDLDDGEMETADTLISEICNAIDEESWDSRKGRGSAIAYAPVGSIVIAQSAANQRKVADFLVERRKKAPALAKNQKEDKPEWVSRTYREPPPILRWGISMGLPQPDPPPGSKLFQPDELAQVIRAFIEPQGWNQPGSRASIEVRGDEVVVCHKPEAHARIERLVDDLEHSFAGYVGVTERAPPPAEKLMPQEELLAEASRKQVDYAPIEEPLPKVVAELARQSKLTITIDKEDLKEVGIDPDYPITNRLQNMSLATALVRLTRECDLTWGISGKEIVVTNPEKNRKLQFTKAYPVDDIVGPPGTYDPANQLEQLLFLATGAIPKANEGNELVSRIQVFSDRPPVILETAHGHANIPRFLQAVRRCRASMLAWNGVDRPPADLPIDGAWRLPSAIDARWDRVRKTPVTWNLVEMPLSEFVEGLSKRLQIPIFIDEKGLRAAGIDSRSPVNFSCQQSPLDAALRRVLRPLELCPIVEGGVLVITTAEVASSNLTACVHTVFDLGWDTAESLCRRDGQSSYLGDLPDMIRSLIAPPTWDTYGGAGTIEYLPRAGAVIVLQTPEMQEEIADLLSRLREALPRPKNRQPSTIPDSWGTRVHRLPDKRHGPITNEQLTAKLRADFAPETWGDAETKGMLLVVGDRLVVRQSMRVQDQISAYLRSLAPRRRQE